MPKIESKDIKIDNNLTDDLERLKNAIEEFKPYSDDFIKNTITILESFNSDFTESIIDTLDNMTDTKAPELLKKLENFKTALNGVIVEFNETDSNVSSQIKGEKS